MFYGVLAAKLAGRPLIVHGEHGLNRSDLKGTPWKRLLAKRFLARLADWIVPVNHPIATHVSKEWKLDGRHVTVIPNGVDLSRFKPRKGSHGSRELVIGMVGRLDDVKDIGTALSALKALIDRGQGDGLSLVLVGDGPMRTILEDQASALGISARVSFTGARSDVESWYGKFDLFLNTSVYEGMCNSLLEAMACGLPLIASRIAGNQAWLREGENALFFEPGDVRSLANAIADLRADRAAREDMGGRNRARAEAEFDNSTFIKVYSEFYGRLLTYKGLGPTEREKSRR
jgi:glycosyltransferase involved in cell wall biosynthesis